MDAISLQLTQKALVGASQNSPVAKTQNYSVEQSSFSKVLDSQVQTNQDTTQQLMQMVEDMGGGDTNPTMNAISADGIQIDVAKAGEVPGTQGVSSATSIYEIFKEVNLTQNNMDTLMEQMNSGKKFSTHELLRLQVFAHQHTATYEMVSKVGEMGNRAIQTPFQMQV